MNRHNGRSTKGWGLLANGHAGQWHIDIDVSDVGDEWSMQIDGPKTYLRFSLLDLQVVPKVLDYLRAGQDSDGVTLGQFGLMAVSIIRDDEFARRWFLILTGEAGVTARLTLDAEDVEALADALQQVREDLPD